jgi:hypothetical protein
LCLLTAVTEAAVGTAYIEEIIASETASFLKQRGADQAGLIQPGTVKANKYRPFSASNPAERFGDS